MSQYINRSLRNLVRTRARLCCEYCLVHEDDSFLPHEPDHIIATKHHGPTLESNLALACHLCNNLKGSDIASVDVDTGLVTRLFNPRVDRWHDHFRLDGDIIKPLTAIGRATEHILQLNRPDIVEGRKLLQAAARYPGRQDTKSD